MGETLDYAWGGRGWVGELGKKDGDAILGGGGGRALRLAWGDDGVPQRRGQRICGGYLHGWEMIRLEMGWTNE